MHMAEFVWLVVCKIQKIYLNTNSFKILKTR